MVRSYCVWTLGNIFVGSYVGIVLAISYNQWDMTCITKEMNWLFVYFFVHVLHIARKVALACFWAKGSDPSILQIKLDLFCTVFLFLPEIGWYIYGNMIVYNNSYIQECKDGNNPIKDMVKVDTGTLRWLMLAILIYGYFYMLIALGICIFFPIVFCLVRKKSDDEMLEPFEDA